MSSVQPNLHTFFGGDNNNNNFHGPHPTRVVPRPQTWVNGHFRNIPEGKKFDKLMAGHTREQQAEQQAAYISGYDMGVYDQGQKDNFTLDEAYVAVYDVAYEAGCLDQKEMYRIETQNYISREEIASQMISDLLDAQEQVVKVDAFVYPVDVHKTCRRLSKKRKGIDGWDSGQPILIELPLISEI